LWLLALCIPPQTLIATYRGASEACLRFRGISLLRMGLGVATFIGPLAVATISTHLAALVGTLLAARVLAWLGFRSLALQALPPATGVPMSASTRRQLLRAGSWFTVSAIIGPLLAQADRFFIGALLSAAAVATYTVPFDVITQLLIGVTAVTTVAFPSITRLLQQDAVQAQRHFRRWLWRVTAGMGLVCATVALVLPAALPLWLASALPAEAATVGRWLCLGVWVNAVGCMFLAWLHANGRFRAVALLHGIELPIYVGLLLVLLAHFGVVGAAMAWTARVTLDAAALTWLARAKA